MSINDATPEEWDRATREVMRGYEITDEDISLCEFIQYHSGEPLELYVDNPFIEYKFREAELIQELQLYINKTYDQHYAGGKIQATEDIIDDGHGTGFCIGNAKKYLKRYGKKGETPAEWRKDLIKVLHYGLIQLYIHDLEHGK